ncbi:SCP2 sterol-binding domain-containing protein [Streptomyces fuscigenes]|uniref:SCP2 sterol-binding domain-containing protein n=1 Tax=Streptomyces fuscigenes TaxID=1528880 RepID=UPI001F36FF88|nr:SCP2 sterol-binding domain-containing protein [Streptomyces fuscigenes]MCF3964296.1 sterol-binding protein [Streptomyces fuscigenes]
MASPEECRNALDRLAESLAGADGAVRGAADLDRTLSCHVTDLGLTYTGRLRRGTIDVDDAVRRGPPAERAQIRLAMASDDLLALVDGRLNFAVAWGSGRVRFEAALRDLLRLRSLL